MQKKYTSLLLSGLVFPGAGQLFNGQTTKGIVYIVLTLCGIVGLVYFAVRGLWRALEYAESSGSAGWYALVQGFSAYRAAIIILVLALLIIWAAGVVDAYLAAREGKPGEGRRVIVRRG